MFKYDGGVGIEIAFAGKEFVCSIDYMQQKVTFQVPAAGIRFSRRVILKSWDSLLRLGLLTLADYIEEYTVTGHI